MQEVDKDLKKLLISKIKEKRELKPLNIEFIAKELALYILQNKKLYIKIKTKFKSETHEVQKSKEFKKLIKEVRARLRDLFSVFYESNFENSGNLIKKLTSENMDEISFEILKLHRSSNERLRYYEEIYDNIAKLTKLKPKLILDLACGYNPFSYSFIIESFDCSPEYVCCDLSDKDITLFNIFFKKVGINARAFYCDLTANREILTNINADICFLFKALDSLETVSKYISETILQEINTKYFVVSFPTKSIGGNKQINPSKRTWFYKLLEKLEYSYEEFSIHNELFLVICKS